MALKDLKSDLSKFRRPIEKPLTDKKRVEVPKSTNQTPLSQFVDKAPSAPKSNTTTPKQGVTPNKFDNSSNYLGETTQTKFDNSSNYLGETTPTKVSLEERFLGQTETQEVQQGDKFKGETETTNITQGDRFKGQTTPQDYSNEEKFKGETTATKFDNTSNFIRFRNENIESPYATEPKVMSLAAKFLGETTPQDFPFTQQFLGETTSNKMNLEARFLGETDIPDVVLESPFKGETTPSEFKFNPKLDQQAKDPKFVDFITDDTAKGFSPYQQAKNNSTFVGVDPSQTSFDNTTSLLSQFGSANSGISFQAGYGKYKVGDPTGDTQRYSPDGSRYIDSYTSIGSMMEKRQSPSFLDEMYHKFNLKDDSPNSLNIIKAPYILRGIQRKKISKGEPQFWDFGLGIDDGFIRGGIVASTTRALVDVARIGSFFLSAKGLLWGVRQIGLQRSQKYGKTWTPVNLLASLAGQHLGLKFDRPGIQPFGDETWKYNKDESIDNSPLRDIYNEFDISKDDATITEDSKGGFDSIYGIGDTKVTRKINTFTNPSKDYGDNEPRVNFVQKINPFDKKFDPTEDAYEKNSKEDSDGTIIGDLVSQTQENSEIPIDKKFRERGLYKSDGLIPDTPDVADYEAISYGTISKLANGDIPENYKGDFRNLKGIVFNNGVDENGNGIEAVSNYTQNNFRKTYGFGQTFKTNIERWTSKERLDKVGLLKPNVVDRDKYENDIVILGFRTDDRNRTQFRGTVSGITETFSPSWNSEKPNGRADKVYMLSEFERTLSFNFKAVAYSRMELEPMWAKLKQLATFAMPYYGKTKGYRGRVLDFTLGDLYKDHSALLTSLSYTMSDEASWEIDKNYTIPKLVDIQVGLTLVGNSVHNEDSTDTLYDYGV